MGEQDYGRINRIARGEDEHPEPVELGGPKPNEPAENWLTALRQRKTAAAENAAERLQGRQVLTIGHSNHSWDEFYGMIRGQKISDVVDVRSHPFSRFAPWSNSNELEERLLNEVIDYHWMGRQLGGRPGDPELYDEAGAPVYERFRAREAYRMGLARLLWTIARKERVVIMCSEENPETCHRKLLIAPDLAAYGVKVGHIRKEKKEKA